MAPQFLNLEQGSPDWLSWRQGGIGASDIPIIMRESPWQSAYGLWLLKTNRIKAKPPTRAQTHGTNSEATARAWYVAEKQIEVAPATAVYDDAEFLRASVDGWNPETRHGVEIKCPTTATAFRRAREGHVPWFYLLQMYGEMEVLDAASWDYCCWYNGQGVIIPVERDSDFWYSEVLPELQEFWDRVQNNSWPRPEGEVTDESPARRAAIAAYLQYDAMISEAEDGQRRAMAYLQRTSHARITHGGGGVTRYEQWRSRYEVKLTADTQEQADRILARIKADTEIMADVRTDKGGSKAWVTPYPPNLVFKVEEE